MDDLFPAEALIEAERRLGSAVQAGDADALERILHPNFVAIRPDGRSLGRGEEIGGLRSGELTVDRIVAEETIATVSGRTGITRRVLTARGASCELPFHARVLCTRTWIQGGPDGWLLLMTRVGPAPPTDVPGPRCGVRLSAGS
ncbi:nuclear transport factor 2 family protein [Streptomyces monticola]|uniref:Nuclear transport factor 2 family protein n=1 Tax=Streptomyces monticola TaxID=2666263 RepID=A0ABW2JFR5_9ACTN